MFDAREIENLRTIFNTRFKSNIQTGSPEQVWKELLKKFSSKCKTGRSECIIAHMINKPKAPDSWISKPTDWLSDQDIDSVEHEFEVLFKDYKFLGCISIDFDLKSPEGQCIVDTLCSTKLRDIYKKGKTKIGIVFNTDVHTGPGEHWMALYCDISPDVEPRITYFDSYAKKPEKEIQRLMLRWKEEWDSNHPEKMLLSYNKTRHQYEDSECGMYCLIFHHYSLNEIPMDKRIHDKVCRSFRELFFNIAKV